MIWIKAELREENIDDSTLLAMFSNSSAKTISLIENIFICS